MSLTTAWKRVRSFRPNGQPLAAAPRPVAVEAPAAPATAPPPGGFYAEVHRPRFSRGVRLVALIAIALFALSGFVGQAIRVKTALSDPPPPPAAPPALDDAAVTQLAVAFTADYWSYDATDPDAHDVAMARWTGRTVTTGTAQLAWDGTGQLHADLVVPGSVTADGDTVLVQTLARVTPATPGAAVTAPRWLGLNVALSTDGGLHVITATSTSDRAAVLTPTAEVDAQATSSTKDFADDVFTAYAAGGSALTYISTPGVDLTGLAGEVTLADVSGWQLSPADADGIRYATADVTWQLTSTPLTITQPYALRVTQTDGRWLVAAISTNQED